ncbi:uncharacterized protein LOC135331124 [Halichondria panicea]|uniref:uncharacterized protein LOC135331124 n=1 Tax=Halichondria panicea TaxID=6063 RepID=UPI00312B75DE
MAAKEIQKVPYDKIPRWSLHNWLVFLYERAPPLVFGLLAAGPCLSGLMYAEGSVDWDKFAWGLIGMMTLLLLVRVMDDVKDFEKDKIVHPDRPLPRGLLRYDEMCTVINITIVAMLAYSIVMGLRFNWTVTGLYLLIIFYAFLMYIEFGISKWLDEHVMINGLIHQLSIYFGALFITGLGGSPWYNLTGWVYLGSVGFSGFFTYEICRKLDPTLPRLKGTYLVVCGKWPTFLAVLATVLVGVVSSYAMGLHRLLWPLEAVMILSVLVLFLLPLRGPKPKSHKPVEALSIIYLLTHMWSPYISSFF